MTFDFKDQISGLQNFHKALRHVVQTENEVVLSGPLPFEALTDGFSPIVVTFDIELIIPRNYPQQLPSVRETSGMIDSDYDHINYNGTLCLAVPIEERRLFQEQPTLLGFVNKLVIPYLYNYCYWKNYGEYPFGEQAHGEEGIIEYYCDALGLNDKFLLLAILCYLFEHGYRGHHACPCGSGTTVRKCHGRVLRNLHDRHTELTLRDDFLAVLNFCCQKAKAEELTISKPLRQQILRILKKKKCQLSMSDRILALLLAIREPLNNTSKMA